MLALRRIPSTLASCLRHGARRAVNPSATRARLFSNTSHVAFGANGGETVGNADGDAFERIVASRQSCGRFDSSRDVDPSVMQRVLEMTFRAPSSFNINPYVLVLAHDAESRKRLSEAMIGEGNAQRVLQAPLTAVFAADLEPARLISETVAMERAAGKSERYCRGLETDAAAILNGPLIDLPTCETTKDGAKGTASGARAGGTGSFSSSAYGREREGNVNMLSGHLHSWAQNLKKTAATAASLALGDSAPVPTINTSEGWAFKNTSIAAGFYLLSCSAFGLATHPMEGFDSRLVCRALNIPWPRYAVPLVVTTGYPYPYLAESAHQTQQQSARISPRPAFEKMVRLDSFKRPLTFAFSANNKS